jgi:hypothetical protein
MIPPSIGQKSNFVKVMTTRTTTTLLLLFLCLVFSLAQTAYAFGPCNPTTKCLPSMLIPYPLFMTPMDDSSRKTIENDDDDEDDTPVVGRPVSRMTNYAAQFLDKTAAEASPASDSDDENEDIASRIASATLEDISEATHLVAIPLESSHELLIELESVQRAILHHCPILLDACIGGTTTRLPLLYVKAPDSNLNDNPQNSASVTGALAGTVKRLVNKHIYGTATKKIADDNNDDVESTEEDTSLNADGYRPLTMTFQSLEIDGDNNNILNTVGSFCEVEDDDTDEDGENENEDDEEKGPNYNERRFENFIRDLQSAIAAQGWKMAFPPDPSRAKNEQADSAASFRPRVAFMELPKSFDENISRFKDPDTEITEEDMKFLKAEEGGNGISPIFWCNWWDDVFARNVRLQEIGIYPTNPMMVDTEASSLVRNSQFYIPFENIALPNGNEEIIELEKKFLDYHKKRIEEKEEEFRKENFESEYFESPKTSDSPLSPGSSKSSEPDVLMTKTRKRLESIYLKDAGFEDSDALIEGLETELQIEDDEDEVIIDLFETKDTRSKDDDYMEDWMKEMIQKASTKSSSNKEEKSSNPTQSAKSSNDIDSSQDPSTTDPNTVKKESDYMESQMKEKVKNAVNSLESVKRREVVDKDPKYSIEDNPVFKAYKEGTLTDKPKPPPTKKLGPYPGNDHFVGIWKVNVNPMGDEGSSITDEGSENLLLRVDGTTAAGPTLNPETNQKAAGGTWKMLPQENGDVLLRIRLIIPPEKTRILVMEGRVNRGSQLGMEMASRTFGIPLVEEKAKEASQGDDVNKMMCSGEVSWEETLNCNN